MSHSIKIIFLDRDGVINKYREDDYVKSWQEFEFLPGSIEAIKLFKKAGYKIYVVTNQRGVARGLMSEQDLLKIHENMKSEIKSQGGLIDGIYYCIHNYEDNCECRKPKPGMLLQAAHDHGFDITEAVFIGDSESDIQAGTTAGCKTILAGSNNSLLDIAHLLTE